MQTEPERPHEDLQEPLFDLDTPLSELVDEHALQMPELQETDLELPYDYLQELDEQGLLEDTLHNDLNPTLLEPRQEPFIDRDSIDLER